MKEKKPNSVEISNYCTHTTKIHYLLTVLRPNLLLLHFSLLLLLLFLSLPLRPFLGCFALVSLPLLGLSAGPLDCFRWCFRPYLCPCCCRFGIGGDCRRRRDLWFDGRCLDGAILQWGVEVFVLCIPFRWGLFIRASVFLLQISPRPFGPSSHRDCMCLRQAFHPF